MGVFRTVLAFAFALGCGVVCAEPEVPPRWDNSRLLGAGEPVMLVLGEEVYAGIGLGKPVLLLPYEEGEEEWNLLVDRDGKLFSFPSESPTSLNVALDFSVAYPDELPKLVLTLGAVFLGKEHVFVAWNTLRGAESENVISRFDVAALRPLRLDPATRLDIIRWRSNGHNGCDLHFGPEDGFLYASTGDGQTPGDPANTGQDTDDLLGSILRLDVSAATAAEPYRIPKDNPFVGVKGTRPELWAYGLRNPWRMAFHPTTHDLWIADNGDTDWEMVHVTKRGANHGWSAFESFHPFRAGNVLKGPSLELTPPIFEHSHAEMRSIIGGVFYQGEALPNLRDHYIYGCYFTKRVWAVSYAAGEDGEGGEGGEIGDPFPIANLGRGLVAFVENGAGEVLVTCHDGAIMKLVPNPNADAEPVPLPKTLSGTGLFTDVKKQALAPGVHRYDVIAESWNDGATKERAFALPAKKDGEGFQVLQGEEVLSGYRPPAGTAFVQTLSLGESPVETQILFYEGVWRGYSYRWREDGSDADLVPEEGANAMIGDQSWRFVSRGECMICHTQKTGFLGAFRTKDLNREHPDGGGNQLELWKQWGFFINKEHGPICGKTPEEWERTVDPYDKTADLDARARVYLDINCSSCHRESGAGGRASFQLMSWPPLADTNMIGSKPMVGITGDPDACIVKPGDPKRSELLHRMKLNIPGMRMPLIGSSVIDAQGVALIEEWIQSLPTAEDAAQ